MEELKIIALTHKNLDIASVGFLHLDEEKQKEKLPVLKQRFGFSELMFLSTCNRIEFIFTSDENVSEEILKSIFLELQPESDNETLNLLAENAAIFTGEAALKHLFAVASSIDSLVVGEREIITQVRKAYEFCNALGLTGDKIRMVIKQTIITAKEIYTQTNIAKNPVSVVSLAYRKLRELNIPVDARFIIVGAGETNTLMAKYLKKHQYTNFSVFNRTVSKGWDLANVLGGTAYPLENLKSFNEGFDVIITCTGSAEPVITTEIYASLLKGEKNKKVVIDLAVPNDLDAGVLKKFDVNLIAVSNLREVAKENLLQRESELEHCYRIIEEKTINYRSLYRERKIELAFSEIPQRVKEIKESAMNDVFAKDLSSLDAKSKEVLDKVISYMEKKYNAVAMKTAKEAMLDKEGVPGTNK
ncbi:MAG: glutamyl-tRNA reductase [Bacteroidia bacterium]|nr:glutamyl-tRNA reductase [Bacteroidia bacterium]